MSRLAIVLMLVSLGQVAEATELVSVDLTGSANAESRTLGAALGVSPWYGPGQVTVEGIPFTLVSQARDLVATPEETGGLAKVAVAGRAREAYLLMGTIMPPPERLYSAQLSPPLKQFDTPERLVIRLRYADGVEELLFPVRLRSGSYEVVVGMAVYCLPQLRDVRIERMELDLRMRQSRLVLAGLTLNTGLPRTKLPLVSTLPAYVPPRPLPAVKPSVKISDGGFVITTASLTARFSTRPGLSLTAIENRGLAGGPTRFAEDGLFDVTVAGKTVSSRQMRVTAVRAKGNRVSVDVDGRPAVPVAGSLELSAAEKGEIVLGLRLKSVADKPITCGVRFPAFSQMTLGTADDTWYFYGRQGGIINRLPTRQTEPYCSRYPTQIMGLSNPKLGGGMYLLVRDLNSIFKSYTLEKNAKGVNWSVGYGPIQCRPGEAIETAETALAGHTGDWRVQLAAYQQWKATWYRSLAPRKNWLRDVYDYHQHHVRTTRPRPGITQTIREADLYDAKTNTYRIREVAAKEKAFFGVQPYIHIFDAGYTYEDSAKHGYLGDYTNFDEIGGKAKLAAAIADAQKAGIPIGFYICGFFCDEGCTWAKKHLDTGGLVRTAGEPSLARFPGIPALRGICMADRTWQDHLSGVSRRIAAEIKPSALYVDCLGFCTRRWMCWSGDHGHSVPSSPMRGEQDLMQKIREAIPAELPLIIEETPTDVGTQFQDAALSYSVANNNPSLAPHRVDLLRFTCPDFKMFQLVSYSPYRQGNWGRLKFPFFNGEGFWFNQSLPAAIEPAAQQFLRRALRILTDHAEAFRSGNPQPLIPTENPLVYANAFPAGKETVWTLFNADFRTYRGPVLEVDHVAGAQYRDLWGGTELKPQVRAGRARLCATLGPRDVGCVAAILPGPSPSESHR